MKKTNPFYEENAIPVSEFRDWSTMTLKPYNKNTASPYTKTRVILMKARGGAGSPHRNWGR